MFTDVAKFVHKSRQIQKETLDDFIEVLSYMDEKLEEIEHIDGHV